MLLCCMFSGIKGVCFFLIFRGFFHGYSFITVLMILNHALRSVAMLTAVVSVFLFNFHLSLAFFLGSTVVSVSVYLHSAGKLR
ncbi:unnamed protein product [Brassica oleracea]